MIKRLRTKVGRIIFETLNLKKTTNVMQPVIIIIINVDL